MRRMKKANAAGSYILEKKRNIPEDRPQEIRFPRLIKAEYLQKLNASLYPAILETLQKSNVRKFCRRACTFRRLMFSFVSCS
jgi:hypothetical protein